jgi:hypothetical protein
MKMLLGCLLLVLLSGCIPIGFAGRTSAVGAPGSAPIALQPTLAASAPDAGHRLLRHAGEIAHHALHRVECRTA